MIKQKLWWPHHELDMLICCTIMTHVDFTGYYHNNLMIRSHLLHITWPLLARIMLWRVECTAWCVVESAWEICHRFVSRCVIKRTTFVPNTHSRVSMVIGLPQHKWPITLSRNVWEHRTAAQMLFAHLVRSVKDAQLFEEFRPGFIKPEMFGVPNQW